METCEKSLEFTEKLTKVSSLAKSNQHRIDDIERRQDSLDNLVQSMARMDARQDRMDTDVQEIKGDVKMLMTKSGRLFDGIVDKLICALIGAFIAWLATALYIVIFSITMIVIFCVKGMLPDTLVTCTMGMGGVVDVMTALVAVKKGSDDSD